MPNNAGSWLQDLLARLRAEVRGPDYVPRTEPSMYQRILDLPNAEYYNPDDAEFADEKPIVDRAVKSGAKSAGASPELFASHVPADYTKVIDEVDAGRKKFNALTDLGDDVTFPVGGREGFLAGNRLTVNRESLPKIRGQAQEILSKGNRPSDMLAFMLTAAREREEAPMREAFDKKSVLTNGVLKMGYTPAQLQMQDKIRAAEQANRALDIEAANSLAANKRADAQVEYYQKRNEWQDQLNEALVEQRLGAAARSRAAAAGDQPDALLSAARGDGGQLAGNQVSPEMIGQYVEYLMSTGMSPQEAIGKASQRYGVDPAQLAQMIGG